MGNGNPKLGGHSHVHTCGNIRPGGETRRKRREVLPGRGAKAADPSLKKLLDWLAAEEAQHRGTFMELKTAHEHGRDGDSWVVRMSSQALAEAVGSHTLSLEEVDFSTLRSEAEIIEAAIVFEEDSIKFYEIIVSSSANRVRWQRLKRSEIRSWSTGSFFWRRRHGWRPDRRPRRATNRIELKIRRRKWISRSKTTGRCGWPM